MSRRATRTILLSVCYVCFYGRQQREEQQALSLADAVSVSLTLHLTLPLPLHSACLPVCVRLFGGSLIFVHAERRADEAYTLRIRDA